MSSRAGVASLAGGTPRRGCEPARASGGTTTSAVHTRIPLVPMLSRCRVLYLMMFSLSSCPAVVEALPPSWTPRAHDAPGAGHGALPAAQLSSPHSCTCAPHTLGARASHRSMAGARGDIIDPPYHPSGDEIDVDPGPPTVVIVAACSEGEGRPQIVPVCTQRQVSSRIIRLTPEKAQGCGTHPSPGLSSHQDRLTVLGIERLKALHEAECSERGCPLGRGRFGHIGPLLRPGHDLVIDTPFRLLCGAEASGERQCPCETEHGQRPSQHLCVFVRHMLLLLVITLRPRDAPGLCGPALPTSAPLLSAGASTPPVVEA